MQMFFQWCSGRLIKSTRQFAGEEEKDGGYWMSEGGGVHTADATRNTKQS